MSNCFHEYKMPRNNKTRNRSKNTKSRKRSDPVPNKSARILTRIPEVPNPVHRFRRATRRQLYWNPVSGIDGTGTTTMQLTFSPGATDYRLGGVSVYTDSLPNMTDFTNLFDQWRITNVMVRIDYGTDMFSNSGVSYAHPLVYHVTDYDDSTDLTLSAMLEYPQIRIHQFKQDGYTPLVLSLEPMPLRDIAGSGVATGYAPSSVSPFIRTAETTIPHYGLKFAIGGAGASINAVIGYLNVIIWYDLEFCNPK